MIYRIFVLLSFLGCLGCSSSPDKGKNEERKEADAKNKKTPKEKKAKAPFQFRETLVKGTDTGIVKIVAKRQMKIEDVLCQRWELIDVSNVRAYDGIGEREDLSRSFEELCLFTDKQFLEDPHDMVKVGKWNVEINGKALLLTLTFDDSKQKQYVIRSVGQNELEVMQRKKSGKFIKLNLNSDAFRHENPLNDPFHPVNNRWRIKPDDKETKAQINERVKQCVRFYALFYRDNIKRSQTDISFRGLPKILKWYNGGIGVYERLEVDDSWIDCFYNKEQAMEGYEIIRKQILNNHFIWPDNAPNWVYQTHAVLEQMYGEMQ